MKDPTGGPPRRLDEPLELDPGAWPHRETYLLLTALVVPRPIAWVSTSGPGGVPNIAPHSFFNLVAHEPPHILFSATGVRDTLRNVRASGDFVVNIVSEDLVEAMNLTAADFPPEEDEFQWAGLTARPSARVTAPHVAEARAHLECRLEREISVGGANLVIGEVVHIRVDPSVWRDGRVSPRHLAPVGRLAGSAYTRFGEVFSLPRPYWDPETGAPVTPEQRSQRRHHRQSTQRPEDTEEE
ncbi:flavin reductase family protein [Streptomyces sp. NPDC051018]|uniref:flavin reductase family protein n=1 Tax=Streptomyces sp. NPDC051018 TaxID=3365639 RepID=UPI0037B9930D